MGLEAIVNRSRPPFRIGSILRRRKSLIIQSDVGELIEDNLRHKKPQVQQKSTLNFLDKVEPLINLTGTLVLIFKNLPLRCAVKIILVVITGWEFPRNTGRTGVLKNDTKETLDGTSWVSYWLNLESKQVRSHLTYIRSPEDDIRVDLNGDAWEWTRIIAMATIVGVGNEQGTR